MSVPVVHVASEFNLPVTERERILSVVKKFQNTYGVEPDFISRSPGRVNLIGEHIDYCDFSVLPMAIDVDMLCAVRVIGYSSKIQLSNDDVRFHDREIDLPSDGSFFQIDPSISDWSNYFKCGLHVAHSFLKQIDYQRFGNAPLPGMKVFCQGSVPAGGGLSSSAAFVCATALAVIRANMGEDYQIAQQDLTRITVGAEHYLGVNNGGMDQAASIFGKEGHALYVEFKPTLRATAFNFPKLRKHEMTFVIANTMVVASKYETAPTNYNLRVVEVTIAANVLAAKYGVSLKNENAVAKDESSTKGNLRDFMNAYHAQYYNAASWDGSIDTGVEFLTRTLALVEETFTFKTEGYSVDEAAAALNISSEELAREYLSMFPVRFEVLKLYQRAKHVYSEALRVLKALRLMTSPSQFASDEEFFDKFGELMNESQESCDKLYDCSCPETDEICAIAKASGAYGSRLTGAGFGGCTVSLVPGGTEGDVEQVKEALAEKFYRVRYPNITDAEIQEAIIVSKPTAGSCLYEL